MRRSLERVLKVFPRSMAIGLQPWLSMLSNGEESPRAPQARGRQLQNGVALVARGQAGSLSGCQWRHHGAQWRTMAHNGAQWRPMAHKVAQTARRLPEAQGGV